jgi:hypothetical protein
MNILEYIKSGGKCKSMADNWFILSEIEEGEEYPIKGFLVINGKSYPYRWTEEGVPHNLPYTHGLNLMPVVEVVNYKSINPKELSKYSNREDFEFECRFG